MNRVGVLLVGLNGATASTFAGGIAAMAMGAVPVSYGTTGLHTFDELNLCDPSVIVVGGWDLVPGSLADALARHGILPPALLARVEPTTRLVRAMPAPRTTLDIPIEPTHAEYWFPPSILQGVERLRDDIHRFQESNAVESVAVIYVGSPHKRGVIPLSSVNIDDLLQSSPTLTIDLVPSGLLFAVAAIQAGAAFLDFTASETLETSGLLDFAKSNSVQVAGRDGSTGQTMLKLAVAQMLEWRNIEIDTWFSDNLIGNHDGYILSLSGHSETKLRDKRDALKSQSLQTAPEHIVKIDYLPVWGDRKESWDAVECRAWLGNEISLRINWRAGDSLLAAPMLLDLVRLVEHGFRTGRRGLQMQLAFFFKRPFGMEHTNLADRFLRLCEAYRSHQ